MSRDARTPVLVGVGTVQQREKDPSLALEPISLMTLALERAAEDAGSPQLLERAGLVTVPRGFWSYSDPGRLVADAVGASQARTEVAELGVLQTTILGRAAQAIADGRLDVALVTGGEAKYRELRGKITGAGAAIRQQSDATPDSVLRPQGEILSPIELQRGLAMPVGFYAMVENAMRAAEGQSLDQHADDVARLWAGMSEVAARNSNAWSRDAVTPDQVRKTDGGNPMLAFPYTKRHNSQWNVDQAAGLILCSLETARSLGIPREKWVFPLAIAESNHMTSLTERRALHRCYGFVHTGRAVFDQVGCDIAAVAHRELYSCFPSAVRSQLRELEICDDRPVTVTGGMAFAGGPLNNFVLQGIARMIEVLRGDPGSRGLVTAISGILTKSAVSLWSTEPADRGFAFVDVSKETAADLETVEVVGEAQGQATIASYTVLFAGEAPLKTVLACDLDDGRRALVSNADPELAATAMREELCGRTVHLSGTDRAELV